MKATEYATKFNSAFRGDGDVFQLLDQFSREIRTLVNSRLKTTLDYQQSAVLEGAIREMRDKWRAVNNRAPATKTINFIDLVYKADLDSDHLQWAIKAAS